MRLGVCFFNYLILSRFLSQNKSEKRELTNAKHPFLIAVCAFNSQIVATGVQLAVIGGFI